MTDLIVHLKPRKRLYDSPILWLLATVAVFLAAGVYLSLPKANRLYERWQGKRYVERAADAQAKGDHKSALLDAQKALRINFTDADATRVIAKSLESLNAPESIVWRRRLGELKPGDTENAIAWAQGAIRAGEPAVAEQALRGLDDAGRNTAEYHEVSALLATQKDDLKTAESHWLEASRLDPTQDRYKLALAALRLRSADEATRPDQMKILNELLAKPKMRLLALRTLLRDASERWDLLRTRELIAALETDPDATFSDKLVCIEALRASNDPEFYPALAKMQEAAERNTEDLYALIAWMNDYSLAIVASEWVAKLPPEVISKPPVCIAVADAYFLSSDWTKLQSLVGTASWGRDDFLRLAFQSQVLKRNGDQTGATAAWLNSLSAAKEQPARLQVLAKLSLERGWNKEAEDAMWAMAAAPNCPRWALGALGKFAHDRRDTASLLKLGQFTLLSDPKNVDVRNSLAFLGLLTKSKQDNPAQLAAELYKENSDNAMVAVTYALSLYQQGKPKDALGVLAALKPEDLRKPWVALYNGIFLAAAGEAGKSREYLELAQKVSMLPEEEELLAQAQGTRSDSELPAKVKQYTEAPKQVATEKLKGEGF